MRVCVCGGGGGGEEVKIQTKSLMPCLKPTRKSTPKSSKVWKDIVHTRHWLFTRSRRRTSQ